MCPPLKASTERPPRLLLSLLVLSGGYTGKQIGRCVLRPKEVAKQEGSHQHYYHHLLCLVAMMALAMCAGTLIRWTRFKK